MRSPSLSEDMDPFCGVIMSAVDEILNDQAGSNILANHLTPLTDLDAPLSSFSMCTTSLAYRAHTNQPTLFTDGNLGQNHISAIPPGVVAAKM